MVMMSPIPYLFVFLFVPLVSSRESIQSRALKIYDSFSLVENIECDARKDLQRCTHFTLYHIYAFAAKVPPSGAGGYITDEPQFACSHVEPPRDNTTEWAALVYYSSMSCDCSFAEKIVHVQAAGYKIALLLEKRICGDVTGNNGTDVTNITIPAVLLSKTVGLSLLRYSSPTDAEPIGSVTVEALYARDDRITAAIVIGSIFGGLILVVAIIAAIAGCRSCIDDMDCTCPHCFDHIKDMECTRPRCFDRIKNMECTRPRCFDRIKNMECTRPRCFDCIKDIKCPCHCTARPDVHGTYCAGSETGDISCIPLQEIPQSATPTSGDTEIEIANW